MNYFKKHLHSIRQYALPGTRALQQELDVVREAHTAVSTKLAQVREDLQSTHEADVRLLADLRQQVTQAKSERRSAHHQIELLERFVAHAEQRQKFTEAHIDSLETKLEEERKRHEESTLAMDVRQAKLQAEQQVQLTRQTELADTFYQASTRLFASLEESNNKQRHSLWPLFVIAGVLSVTGILVGALFMQSSQDSSQVLAAVERDIHDMRGFMKEHINNQDALLKELALTLNRQTSAEQALLGEKPLQLEVPAQGADTQSHAAVTLTPDLHALQASLMALGFDLGISKPDGEPGIKTRQALQEFRQFYLPDSDAQDDVVTEPLAALILSSADLARADAARFNIGSDVLAAIRLGSIRTGVDFSFLMELARVESSFNPAARAPKSTATGLFQFMDYSWIEAIRKYGANYGLKDYATRVKLIDDGEQGQPSMTYDPLQLEVLALRLNPRLSTLLAAENIKRNKRNLSSRLRRKLGRTDLYLSHFFGLSGAVKFLETLNEKPASTAGELFPKAVAARNRDIFQSWQKQPRTVAEVYQWFDSKFNTTHYSDK